jgi:hypothetical protein
VHHALRARRGVVRSSPNAPSGGREDDSCIDCAALLTNLLMSWLRRLERKLQPWAIPNLTQLLIAGMVVVYIVSIVNPALSDLIELRPRAVLKGEVWRLLTFLFLPGFGAGFDPISILFFVMYLMFLHLMGSALESTWGSLRFNLFVLISYLASIAATILVGAVMNEDESAATNLFLYTSIFLAFAWLFPDFQILLFFFLPVKVKWIALITVLVMGYTFLVGLATFFQGGWLTCVLILAANLNLSLFLGREVAERIRNSNKRLLRRFGEMNQKPTARHVCIVCGASDLTHPDRDFRYCTECRGTPAYCNQHLAGHKHLESIAAQLEKK